MGPGRRVEMSARDILNNSTPPHSSCELPRNGLSYPPRGAAVCLLDMLRIRRMHFRIR